MSGFIELLKQLHETYTWLLPTFFTILALIIFTFINLKRSPIIKKCLPPCPKGLPPVGNLHQIGLHPHRSLRTLAQTYGPIMLPRLGSTPVLVVSSADFASEIMKTHDLVLANRPKSIIAKKLLYDHKDVSSAPYGEYWRQMKSVSVVHLLSNKKVKSFCNVREEETAYMIEKIKKSCFSSSVVNLSEIFAMLTNDVVCRVALGRKYSGSEGKNFMELLKNFVELLGGFNVGDYIPWLAWLSYANGLDAKLDKVAKEFDNFLDGVVEEHMVKHQGSSGSQVDEEQKEDFVDVLLRIQKDNTLGFSVDRISIKAIILDSFAEGTDTTYTVLEWAMTGILRHPEVMNKLKKEVREPAKNKSAIREDDLQKMQFLKAVIKETLRLHPPIPLLVPRESTQDVKVKGFDIAAGTQVIINAWAIGRDSTVWDRAEEFMPERFLNSSIDFRGQDFELIPFGAGRRGCPGTQFAVSIEQLALANVLLKFDWKLPEGARGEDLPRHSSCCK